MATLICKQIKTRGLKDKSFTNYTRIVSLLNYISAPEVNQNTNNIQSAELINYISTSAINNRDKCTSVLFLNSFTMPDVIFTNRNDIKAVAERAKLEFASVIDGSKYKDNPAILRHYVMSWSTAGQQPTMEQIMARVRQFCHDMGYRQDNLILAGIHSNTGNIHVHIFVCRLSSYNTDTPPVRENGGWTHNGIMQFLARESVREPDICALEPTVGHIYRPVIDDNGCPVTETITETHPINGRRVTYERIVVKKMSAKQKKPRNVGNSTSGLGPYQGIKTNLEILAEIVEKVDAKIKHGWRFGHVYRALAKNGIFVDVSGPEHNRGIVLSLDGTHWCRATKIAGDGWKISELQKRLGAAEFRPPRKNIAEIAASVRAKHPLGALKLDDDVELIDDCSGIETEISSTETPTKPEPTEAKASQNIFPIPSLHRPFHSGSGPNSPPVLSRREVESTPERKTFSQDLAQRILRYRESIPLVPAPVMETMAPSPAKKRSAPSSNSVPVRRKSFLPPARFWRRSRGLFHFPWRSSRWMQEHSRHLLYQARMGHRYRIAWARTWAARNNETGSTRKPEGPATETAALYQ